MSCTSVHATLNRYRTWWVTFSLERLQKWLAELCMHANTLEGVNQQEFYDTNSHPQETRCISARKQPGLLGSCARRRAASRSRLAPGTETTTSYAEGRLQYLNPESATIRCFQVWQWGKDGGLFNRFVQLLCWLSVVNKLPTVTMGLYLIVWTDLFTFARIM